MDQTSFDGFFGTMPWLAVPFEESDIRSALSEKFHINGISTLVVLKSDGTTITTEGRREITSGKMMAIERWMI